jgi:3-dehydroquinate synthase
MTLSLTISPPLMKTDIFFGLDRLSSTAHSFSKRGAILADAEIAKTWGEELKQTLSFDLILVPKHKTREAKQALEDELFKLNLGRDSVLIAVGGGTTTDLVAFLASTYMRGIPLILVPTTLLAMVDACIGGKTGVDTPYGKNLIGSFYLPKAIFIDTRFLKALPEKEIKNGFSEILKYGLIQKKELWDKITDFKVPLEALIQESIQCKMQIVSQDFEEKTGLRRVLNFGHTVGHALELVSEFRLSHGEAVAIGCMAESLLSHLLGYLSQSSLEEIFYKYQTLGYRFKKFDKELFLNALKRDKKAKGTTPRFVLIDQIGCFLKFKEEYCREVDEPYLNQMIEMINHD